MAYNIKYFRRVKHKQSDINAFCRHCSFELFDDDKNVIQKAKQHAQKTLHTIDVYRENHTEYTSYVPQRKE